MLSNFESDTAKQLQIVLTGQPEMREVLNDPSLRQLKQRVALRCEIKPLPSIEETNRYIISRLLVAGAERTDIFSPAARTLSFARPKASRATSTSCATTPCLPVSLPKAL